jgi:hypothetical protein
VWNCIERRCVIAAGFWCFIMVFAAVMVVLWIMIFYPVFLSHKKENVRGRGIDLLACSWIWSSTHTRNWNWMQCFWIGHGASFCCFCWFMYNIFILNKVIQMCATSNACLRGIISAREVWLMKWTPHILAFHSSFGTAELIRLKLNFVEGVP